MSFFILGKYLDAGMKTALVKTFHEDTEKHKIV